MDQGKASFQGVLVLSTLPSFLGFIASPRAICVWA